MVLINTQVIREGDESGNGMLLKWVFPSGLEIYGLPTRNHYSGEWDLGPTWNYLLLADEPVLVDTGRFNQWDDLMAMIEEVGLDHRDLGQVVLSHGHEDHDGGVSGIVKATGARLRAHAAYDRLVRFNPDLAPPDRRRDFPAACWNCFMPDSFIAKHCLAYHRENAALEVDEITEAETELLGGIKAFHTPGHSPDAISLILGDEAAVVGDTVLPEITPWPTCEFLYEKVGAVLSPDLGAPHELYGLRAYIKSLQRLKAVSEQNPGLIVLPAHRLYYRGQWNDLDLGERISELFDHHRERCSAILDILNRGPVRSRQITEEYFDETLLKGPGLFMAENEILSHLELMVHAGDVEKTNESKYKVTGSHNFEQIVP